MGTFDMKKLTMREREIVTLLAQGQRQADIARLLCISHWTVRDHVKHAREKTASKSTFDLAVKAAIENTQL